jgi:Kef-type K+ transport system membrane component KefB/nucleotide-binding universal stress UspA family protein
MLPLLAGAFVCVAIAATAAGQKSGVGITGGPRDAVLIAEIALLMLVGRGLGEVFQRFGQPAVIGQLVAGLLLGPSFFGWIWPQAHAAIFPNTPEQRSLISGISEVGVLLLLLITGMETDLKLARRIGRAAFAVTGAGIAIPFACGFVLGELLPDSILPHPEHRLVTSLFLGIALSISSIKIVAMVVREMNFLRRNLGQIIVGSAIMEDTIGWVIISIALGLAGAGLELGALAGTVIGTALFLIASYTLGRPLVFWLIRWVNDTFVSEYAVVTAILVVMCVMAAITQAIGVNAVLGAFVAGVLVGESPILSQQIDDEIRGFITAFLAPIFFGLSGLTADLTILKDPHLALLTIGLVAIASIGKFGGAFIGGRVSGLTPPESIAVGCAMNARGSTEVIVASIGLATGALTQNLYTMIVTMAVVTTLAMPPALRWALNRLPMSDEERERLQKEELGARGFVSAFERLLIVADGGENGEFASRIAGFIAGQRGKPMTVLHFDGRPAGTRDSTLKEAAVEAVKAGHVAATAEQGEERPERVPVSARVEDKVDVAVSKEAAKGYDALFVGLSNLHAGDGSFSDDVDIAIANFGGPFVLADAGDDDDIVRREQFNILVPVNGTDAARRGAELAFAMAPASKSQVTILQVADRAPDRRRRRKRIERAVLEDMTALGKQYGHTEIRSAVHKGSAPDSAIMDEVRRSKVDVIVMGANRRVGDHLYLGQTVSCVMRRWKGPIVLVVA